MAEGEADTRPVFGARYLSDPSRVYEHNAWDSVEWDEDQERLAQEKVQLNSSDKLPGDHAVKFETEAALHWDGFYHQHQNKFFKDRHWLFTEFPELKSTHHCEGGEGGEGGEAGEGGAAALKETDSFNIFEVGCGAGNTVFPILQANRTPGLFVYCCDFAESAVRIVKEHSLYDPSRCHAFQYDVTMETNPLPFLPGTIDTSILIFVLSAIQPSRFQFVVKRLAECLRPGGTLLFRDYGRYDMAQLRFKKGQCLAENFYVRGDGTRVFFFTAEEVSALFSGAGLAEEELHVDRRLQVNRARQLKMYRIWIQAKYRKPLSAVAQRTYTTEQ